MADLIVLDIALNMDRAFTVIEQRVNKVLDVELVQVSLFNSEPIGSHCSNYTICQVIRILFS